MITTKEEINKLKKIISVQDAKIKMLSKSLDKIGINFKALKNEVGNLQNQMRRR